MDMETNDCLIYSHPKLKPRHFPMPSQRVEPHFCFADAFLGLKLIFKFHNVIFWHIADSIDFSLLRVNSERDDAIVQNQPF